jgi:hypothetical protein
MTTRKQQQKTELKVELKEESNVEWVSKLYDTTLISEIELKSYYEAFQYVGFNRNEMLKELERIVKDPKLGIQLVILCALRGPLASADIKLTNGLTPKEMGIPGSGQISTKNLSCSRITAATADLAAFYMRKLNVGKRLIDEECPGWLQFPSAGSIKLPDTLRRQHVSFAKKFSGVIGGTFREEIYSTMVMNAYYDDKLRLFD